MSITVVRDALSEFVWELDCLGAKKVQIWSTMESQNFFQGKLEGVVAAGNVPPVGGGANMKASSGIVYKSYGESEWSAPSDGKQGLLDEHAGRIGVSTNLYSTNTTNSVTAWVFPELVGVVNNRKNGSFRQLKGKISMSLENDGTRQVSLWLQLRTFLKCLCQCNHQTTNSDMIAIVVDWYVLENGKWI
jgi:hypothetical protein